MSKAPTSFLHRSDFPHVFTMEDGKRFNSSRFCKIWKKAVDSAGITYVTSYSARHSFAAWSLIVGINPLRLVKLMGHASKQMVYEVYGNNDPPAEPEVLRLLAPQRGLTAIG